MSTKPKMIVKYEVMEDVLIEAERAVAKHGLPTSDPVRAVAVMAEELGEATEHALKLTSRDTREHGATHDLDRLQLFREELCQLAGYVLLQIQNIDSGGIKI
jgi:NTP pyrophosphatase (non-canonical NTP hydrolase)